MNLKPSTRKQAACVFIPKSFDGEKYLFLTATRRGKPQDYNLIGGKVDEGETPEQAIIREAKEEADIELKNIQLLYVAEDADGYECFCFTADFDGVPLSKEPGIDIGWVEIDTFLAKTNTYWEYNTIVFDIWGCAENLPVIQHPIIKKLGLNKFTVDKE
jgi:8-oxo-dGTP pyrophosphatase MutT (NUDIX family)